ncbi:MAG: UvrD-helicase domain-containing protein [Actinomycetota bacterium]|nr:UvrD-helicase domain-containing protein [Actinomycetota bacterium]
MAHPDLAAEQAHVDHAYEQLEAMRANALAMLRAAFGERGGTFQAITERDIRVRTSLNRLEQLQLGRESLVFGRIDRLAGAEPDEAESRAGQMGAGQAGAGGTGPGGTGQVAGPGGSGPGGTGQVAEAFHIGRLAVADNDQEPLVVDWRAPVAEPFYRATGAQPMGLTRRRHFLTEGRRVLDLEDELFGGPVDGGGDGDEGLGVVGLGAGLSGSATLLSALARSRTGRMRDIVATVQREQDEIIRSPLSGILVVQGGPGTGKTAVALHRAAYLLYTYRFPLESQGVLVVGPNPLFLRYIEHVLPSLGETGVEMATVGRLFGQASATGVEDRATAALKGDARMAEFLARAVASRERPLRRPIEIPFGPVVLTLTPAVTADVVRAAKRRSGAHNARRRVVEQLLWRHLHARLLEARARRVQEAPAPSVRWSSLTGTDEVTADVEPYPAETDLTPADLGNDLRRLPVVAQALDRMWPVLTPHELLHDLFGAPPLVELAGRGLLSDDEQQRLARPRSESTDAVAWTEADLALLDEARFLLGPAGRRPPGDRGRDQEGSADENAPRAYGHIVVDEAQDLSPMQWRMLGRRSLSSSMTIVGDIAQATGSWAPGSWTDALAHLPVKRGSRVVELTVNYRTPSEIMDLAGQVLDAAAPGMVAPQSVRTTGVLPRILTTAAPSWPAAVAAVVTDEAAAVLGESAQGGTIGVICAPSMVDQAAAALADAGLEFGSLESGALDDTVTLVAVGAVKGLEFDSVIVVEPARIVVESAQGLRALYVALTRATRRLSIVHGEALPAPLRS